MPDYPAFLDSIYAALGVQACLDAAIPIALTVIDKSNEAVLDLGNGVQFGTDKIVVCVRVSELEANCIDRDAIQDLMLSFNGNSYEIVSTRPKPKPSGPGELYLILQNA